MLTMTLAVLLTQSSECRFSADWLVPMRVDLVTARGEKLGSMFRSREVAAKADVLLRGSSAVVTIHFKGAQLEGRVRSLPVTSSASPNFGFGFRTVESSLLSIARSDGNSVDVTPWKFSDVETRFKWVAQSVPCSSLKLGTDEIASFCTASNRVDIALKRGGVPVWRTAYQSLEVDDDGRTEAKLKDGSVVTGWSKMPPGISGTGCGSTSCGIAKVKSQTCSNELTLFSRGGEEVGSMKAGTPFVVRETSSRSVEIEFEDAPFEGRLTVKRAEFDKC